MVFYGFIVDEESIVCPKCAKAYRSENSIEGILNNGYPDGYTCDDCGKVVE